MSRGTFCNCVERKKTLEFRNWLVIDRYCNYSAFSGYRHTPSNYSSVFCKTCRHVWRTKAKYVSELFNATNEDFKNP